MKTKRNFIRRFIKTTLLLSGILLFMASAGQDAGTSFDDWDTDGDDRIYENEFNEHLYDETYGTDVTREDIYDEDQFYESAFDWWDTYDDQRLDETEWDFGYEHSFGKYVDGDFDAYDADSDNYLSPEEYRDALGDTDYFSSFDVNDDDYLDADEYSSGLFSTYDVNEDDFLDEDEFEYLNFD